MVLRAELEAAEELDVDLDDDAAIVLDAMEDWYGFVVIPPPHVTVMPVEAGNVM